MPVINARFIAATSSRGERMTLVGPAVPVGFELVEELVAPLRFVGLADRLGRRAQPVERAQEAAVLLVAPADVARTAPAGLAQLVEPAVVADAEARVRLDVVARELAEA